MKIELTLTEKEIKWLKNLNKILGYRKNGASKAVKYLIKIYKVDNDGNQNN